jgi:hypothetical protein
VHGNIVLSRNEFEDAYANHSNLANFLISTFEADPMVFYGCRLQEPSMWKMFELCKRNQDERIRSCEKMGRVLPPPPPRYILLPLPMVSGSPDEEEDTGEMMNVEEHYGGWNILPVWYDSREEHLEVKTAFEKLLSLPDASPQFGWGGGNSEIR